MKRRCAQLYLIGMLVIALLPLAAMTVHAQTEAIGNETEVPMPHVRTADGGWNLHYLEELGDWFEAHYAFRAELISVNSLLQNTFFRSASSDTVIAGTDGWLYYAATLDDYQHNNSVSERTLFNEAHNVALYQEAAEEAGATFLFTIAPNKNTLYGEHMPQNYQFQVAQESDLERLVPYLEGEGVHYVDLTELFTGTDEILYYERDSHWNEKGAVLVYNRLLDAADVAHETYEDVIPTAVQDYYGDLANMLYPDSRAVAPETRLIYQETPHWSYTNETTSVEENYITTESVAGSGTLLMYRDSFGNSLLPYMAEAFEEATFSKNEPLDGADLKACDPDIVIYEKVERHLPTLSSVPAVITGPVRYASPDDMAGKEIAEDAESGTTCTLGSTNGYVTISGVLCGESVGEKTRVYVAVTNDAGTTVYEAYTVNASAVDASGTATESDYGYLLYLGENGAIDESSDVCVLAVNEDADGEETLTAVYGTLDVPEEIMEQAAADDSDTDESTEAETTEESGEANAEVVAADPTTDTQEATVGETAVSAPNVQSDMAALDDTQSSTNSSDRVAQSSATDSSNGGEQSRASSSDGSSDAGTSTSGTAVTESPAVTEGSAGAETPAAAETPADTETSASTATQTPPVTESQATTPASAPEPAAPYEVSRVFIEDCGYDSGYWDITYSDGSHQYIDVP